MIYAQFHQKSAISDAIVEACGDRGVIVLDGRHNLHTNHEIASTECAKRGYLGYSLHIGEAFSRSMPVSAYRPVAP